MSKWQKAEGQVKEDLKQKIDQLVKNNGELKKKLVHILSQTLFFRPYSQFGVILFNMKLTGSRVYHWIIWIKSTQFIATGCAPDLVARKDATKIN